VFTGIIEETGTVLAFEPHTTGARLRIHCQKVREDLLTGDSVSVNGVCLTAVGLEDQTFAADLAPETLGRSNLGDLLKGHLVNLERSMPANGRYSGHIVQGHVDGTGELLALDLLGDSNWWLTIRVPAELDRYIVHKGSICIDGISLTVAELEGERLSATIIPHTYAMTAMRQWTRGRRLNLEVDVIAKYIEKLIAARK
jgi:riboflavin synthase